MAEVILIRTLADIPNWARSSGSTSLVRQFERAIQEKRELAIFMTYSEGNTRDVDLKYVPEPPPPPDPEPPPPPDPEPPNPPTDDQLTERANDSIDEQLRIMRDPEFRRSHVAGRRAGEARRTEFEAAYAELEALV